MLTTADKIRTLHAKGMMQADIARKLGISRQRVGQIVHGYKPNKSLAVARQKEMLRWLNRKPRLTYEQIADKMDVHPSYIGIVAKNLRVAGLYSGRYRVQQEAAE